MAERDFREGLRADLNKSAFRTSQIINETFADTQSSGFLRDALSDLGPARQIDPSPVFQPGAAGALGAALQGPEAVARLAATVQSSAVQNRAVQAKNIELQERQSDRKARFAGMLAEAEDAYDTRKQAKLDAAEADRRQIRGDIAGSERQERSDARADRALSIQEDRAGAAKEKKEDEQRRLNLKFVNESMLPLEQKLHMTLPSQDGQDGQPFSEARLDVNGQPVIDPETGLQAVDEHLSATTDPESLEKNWEEYEKLARRRNADLEITDPEAMDDYLALQKREFFRLANDRFENQAVVQLGRLEQVDSASVQRPAGLGPLETEIYNQAYAKTLQGHMVGTISGIAKTSGVDEDDVIRTMPESILSALRSGAQSGTSIGIENLDAEGVEWFRRTYGLIPGMSREEAINIAAGFEETLGTKLLDTKGKITNLFARGQAGVNLEQVPEFLEEVPWDFGRDGRLVFKPSDIPEVGEFRRPSKAEAFTNEVVDGGAFESIQSIGDINNIFAAADGFADLLQGAEQEFFQQAIQPGSSLRTAIAAETQGGPK